MSSAADTLRRAAEVLRERAEAAAPGPWDAEESAVWWQEADGQAALVASARRFPDDDAAYIATVDPTLGLALAAWLDDTADYLDHEHITPRDDHPVLAVARAILRDQP
jgi:hypothetical protein